MLISVKDACTLQDNALDIRANDQEPFGNRLV